MKKGLKISLILVLFLTLGLPAGCLRAQVSSWLQTGFNPNYLLSDSELVDHASWNGGVIQKFLESKPGALAQKTFIDLDGLEKSAATIIDQAGQRYKISPKVILALLQKEQSLIDNPNPTQYNFDWATGYGRCDACNPDDPAVAKFKGFAKQVDSAAGALRFFLETGQGWLKQPGLIYSIDAIPIIPANQATANLYTYTPHLEGNYNFWKIWQGWFSKIFPDGVVVQDGGGQIWLIQNGQKYPFKSKTAFYSRYGAKSLLQADKTELVQYANGPAIKYPNFSLLKNKKGEIYLIVENKKRLIEKNAFRYYGFDPEEVVRVADEDLDPYLSGEPVTIKAKYPLGILLKNAKTGGVYFVANSIKYPIWDKNIIKTNFSDRKLRTVTLAELKKYQEGEPIKFEDGTLLKTVASPEIYFISNGERRLIKDETTFDALGWQKENIITTTEKVLGLHPLGGPIALPYSNPAALTQTGQ